MQRSHHAHYKHYIGVTSQIAFCQVPLRLDSFNQCSFSCSYCFAKSRGGNRGPRKLQISDAANLENRFRRIGDGHVASAVDEFLKKRIPIQLGGMTDPFSPFEQRSGATLRLVRILMSQNYPTLISTKGTILGDTKYLEMLAAGNFLVRFSISVIREAERTCIEQGTPPLFDLLRIIEILT